MDYFVAQVQTGSEEEFVRLSREGMPHEDVHLVWPRRELTIRRAGKQVQSLAPLFPGYVFIEAEEISIDLYWALRRTPGFYRFLESNTNILPLGSDEKKLLLHFLSFGEVVRKSRVIFDRNSRIRVVSGPMEGLEGLIVKVDKRKGRAKVRLDLYKDSFLVDLGFDIISADQSGSKDRS